MEKKSIGILYICTGPYVVFWKDFYTTFEENFLSDTDKYYYVFTDSDDIFASSNPRVKKITIAHLPWPLITLLRFSTFLSIEDELNQRDYLMFSNANLVCVEKITSEEFLPRAEQNEEIFVTKHPGYFEKHKIIYPYERNKKSLAYIPWNCGKYYIMGGMFGGTSSAFLKMSHTLKTNIEEDLKKNYIALWHDESHLNRYIINKDNIRFLHPSYCYPIGMTVSYEKKIGGVRKQDKFDHDSFKGIYIEKETLFQKVINRLRYILRHSFMDRILYICDTIQNKQLNEIQ